MLAAAPRVTCMWPGTGSCWDYGAVLGGECRTRLCAALLWVVGRQSCPGCLSCAVAWGAWQCHGGDTRARSLAGWAGGLVGALHCGRPGWGAGGRGCPGQAVPGRKQPALAFPWGPGSPCQERLCLSGAPREGARG